MFNTQVERMPKRNGYLDNFLPYWYQRQTYDIAMFAFIDAYTFSQPSVTLREASDAFLKRYGISEDLHDVDSIMTSYQRIKKDFYDAQKTENRQKRERGAD